MDVLFYFRYTFWDTFVEVYNLSDAQMANLQTAYGIFALVAYVPGGWLADRVSVKKLLLFSLFASALTGVYLLTIPGYYGVLACHAFLGVTSILTFWPAFIKAIRSLASDSEQGKAFGLMEGTRGVFNILEATLALGVFAYFVGNSNTDAIQKVIIYYIIALVIVGIVIALTVKDVDHTEMSENNEETVVLSKKERREIIVKELKRPSIWLISGIVFCSYMMNILFYNFTPYAQNVLKLSAVVAGMTTVLAQWVRPIAAVSSGILGDKIKITSTVKIGFILMIIGTGGVLVMPTSISLAVFMVAIGIIYIGMYSLQANHFALMEEGEIHREATGTAVGIISTIGYLPEVIGSQIALWILTHYGINNGGSLAGSYNLLFTFMLITFVVGLILTFVLSFMHKT
ncbi:MAG: MFS transporter [Erysipelotrichales bacterium]